MSAYDPALREEIKKLLREKSREGRITCKEAREIAERFNVAYGAVGKAANGLRIKISNCELGCF